MAQAITLEFIELAVELIDDFVEEPNAVWVSIANDSVADSDEPWNTTVGNSKKYDVKIVFTQDALEDRQLLRYLDKTAMRTGQVNGIMYDTGFAPKLKDIVKWDSKELVVRAIDPIQTIDDVIVYILEFGT